MSTRVGLPLGQVITFLCNSEPSVLQEIADQILFIGCQMCFTLILLKASNSVPHPLPHQLSFDLSEYTGNVDGIGTLRLLDAIRTCGLEKHVKFYQVCLLV